MVPGHHADVPRAIAQSAPLCTPCHQPAAPLTLLLPSARWEHVHGMGEEQQQAEWRPHLGSLVGAGARGFPRRPDVCSRRAGTSAGRGLDTAARHAPSAQGPAARSSEGVCGAGTLPRLGGAGAWGGALTSSDGARGWGRGSPGGGRPAGVGRSGRFGSPRSGVVPPPALPHTQTRRRPARRRYKRATAK